ncbi:MAG: fructosamine kinase family protein [Gammaproteobacteria bacterium]|nr:fructosamine kinase family protein [Gammaproteobacteria bacterium]
MSPIPGGCINEINRLTLNKGHSLILKTNNNRPPTFFAAEAAGLDALRRACSLRVPRVIILKEDFLVLEDLGNAPATANYWHILGEGLAELHGNIKPDFGFNSDNYCGLTPQSNPPTADGFVFFGQFCLLALGTKAEGMGLLTSSDLHAIETIAHNLPRWIPAQPAVLIHGDLWSGNVHCDKKGQPALIDPACYWGWAEAELSMTMLFGGFDRQFYSAYESASDIATDWRERAPLYNLYHLLNHLVLFGEGYLAQVRTVVKRYSG